MPSSVRESEFEVSVVSDVAASENENSAHFGAILELMEGMKNECEKLKRENESLQIDSNTQKVQIAALEEEIIAREEVVMKMQDMMTKLPPPQSTSNQPNRELEENLSSAKRKIQQQEKYITELEKRLHNSRETQEAVAVMASELGKMKHHRSLEIKQHKILFQKQQQRAESAFMCCEDLVQQNVLDAQKRVHLEKRCREHSHSIFRIKDEQIKSANMETAQKEEQLRELRTLTRDLMTQIKDSLEKKSEMKVAFELAKSKIRELEETRDAVKDTRKQTKKEIHGVLATAKEMETQWGKDRSKMEEIIGKQRAKIQITESQLSKTEQTLADLRTTFKKTQSRTEVIEQSITKTFNTICNSSGLQEIFVNTTKFPAIRSEKVNCKEKLRHIVETNNKVLESVLETRRQLLETAQSFDSLKGNHETLSIHASWLESEMAAVGERNETFEKDVKRLRSELSEAMKSSQQHETISNKLKDSCSRLEDSLAEKHDALSALQQRFTSDMQLTQQKLILLSTEVAASKSESAELMATRERIVTLTTANERVSEQLQQALQEKEVILKEKETVLDLKNKHQKGTTKYIAEAKRLKSESTELEKKNESLTRTVEQLRKQKLQKEGEVKSRDDTTGMLRKTILKKDSEMAALRNDFEKLIKELQVINSSLKQKGVEEKARDSELTDLNLNLQRTKRELAEITQHLTQTESELFVLREKESRRAESLRETTPSIRTPLSVKKHKGDRIHQQKQIQNQQNLVFGVDTPYSKIHASPRRSPASSARNWLPSPGGYSASPSPSVTPKRMEVPTPPKFDEYQGSVTVPVSEYEACSSVTVVGAAI